MAFLTEAYQKTDQTDTALAVLRKAHEQEGSAESALELSLFLLDVDERLLHKEFFHEAVTLAQSSHTPWFERGKVHLDRQDYHLARADFEQALTRALQISLFRITCCTSKGNLVKEVRMGLMTPFLPSFCQSPLSRRHHLPRTD